MPTNNPFPTDDHRNVAQEDALDSNPGHAALGALSHWPRTEDRPPTPLPGMDQDCHCCKSPLTLTYAFDPSGKKYLAGEVLQIQESAHTPIDQLFVRIARTTAGQSSHQRLSSAHFYQEVDRHPRPGVVMEMRRIKLSKEKTYTCVMATYHNTHTYDRLPPVLQHFCIPVSPHCEVAEKVAHLHTSLEWQRWHVWIVAYPFFSSGEVLGRWEWRDATNTRTPDRSFIVNPDMMRQLREIEQRKWEAWNKFAEDYQYLVARYNEYEEFKQQGAEKAKKESLAKEVNSAPTLPAQASTLNNPEALLPAHSVNQRAALAHNLAQATPSDSRRGSTIAERVKVGGRGSPTLSFAEAVKRSQARNSMQDIRQGIEHFPALRVAESRATAGPSTAKAMASSQKTGDADILEQSTVGCSPEMVTTAKGKTKKNRRGVSERIWSTISQRARN